MERCSEIDTKSHKSDILEAKTAYPAVIFRRNKLISTQHQFRAFVLVDSLSSVVEVLEIFGRH